MADGRDDNFNRAPGRGRKLRNQGSNPTGDQTMSFSPEYSEEMDYRENVALAKSTRMSESNYAENISNDDCCRSEGLSFKQPLS